jgi:hypothetical protein
VLVLWVDQGRRVKREQRYSMARGNSAVDDDVEANDVDLDYRLGSSARSSYSLSTNVKRRLGRPPGLIPLPAARAIGVITPPHALQILVEIGRRCFFHIDVLDLDMLPNCGEESKLRGSNDVPRGEDHVGARVARTSFIRCQCPWTLVTGSARATTRVVGGDPSNAEAGRGNEYSSTISYFTK